MSLMLPLLFVLIKIAFSVGAFLSLYYRSEFLLVWFGFFILFDVLDSTLIPARNQKKYRFFDTIGDRIFMFANFIGFLLFRFAEYPVIIFIILPMFIRDLTAFYFIRQKKAYYIESSSLDKITIFLSAVLFAFEASFPQIISSYPIMLSNICIAFLIILQGYDKVKRIMRIPLKSSQKNTSKVKAS